MTVPSFEAKPATAQAYALGEGVRVDGSDPVWVDIPAGEVIVGRWEDVERLGEQSRLKVDTTVGAVGFAADRGLIVAGARRLWTVSIDGRVVPGLDLMPAELEGRLNDGAVDPQGRFVVGSLRDLDETPVHCLWRVTAEGDVEVLRHHVGLSNGIGWSPDGSVVYHVDTAAGTLASHSYGESTWDADDWHVIPCRFGGVPDGLAVDENGDIWVALWGGSAVQCFSPAGDLKAEVQVPTPNVTCLAFVGDGRMLITTAAAPNDPGAGLLYSADVGIRGVSEGLWSGSTL